MALALRILDTITTPQGAKRLLVNRVEAINADSDFENHLACPPDEYFTKNFNELAINFIPFKMSRALNPFTTFGEISRCYILLKELKPQVIHAHTSKAGAVSRIACALYNAFHKEKIYICYQVHSFYFNALSGFKRFVYLILEKRLASISDSILFQNEHELQQAQEEGMGRKALLINIGNGIKLNEFPFQKAPRIAHNFRKGETFRIICVARIEMKKNHRMLINACGLLLEELTKSLGNEKARLAFHVDCVGEIGDASIIGYAKEKSLADIVSFTGVCDRVELEKLLQDSDISVLSSTAEGKPRALMEAMNAGLPCVATDVVGTREVIIDGETGFLIPLGDEKAFAKAILSLMEDPALYERYSIASQNRARTEFDENKVIEKLKNIYREKPRQA